jgi:hypothetical protein
MELEVAGLTGAAHGARDPDWINHRSGYRDRDWETQDADADGRGQALQHRHIVSEEALMGAGGDRHDAGRPTAVGRGVYPGGNGHW